MKDGELLKGISDQASSVAGLVSNYQFLFPAIKIECKSINALEC